MLRVITRSGVFGLDTCFSTMVGMQKFLRR